MAQVQNIKKFDSAIQSVKVMRGATATISSQAIRWQTKEKLCHSSFSWRESYFVNAFVQAKASSKSTVSSKEQRFRMSLLSVRKQTHLTTLDL